MIDSWGVVQPEGPLIDKREGVYRGGVARIDRQAVLAARAAGLPVIELVAVGGADAYWQRLGFAYAAPGVDGPYGPGTFVMRRPVEA